jgi:hypothetical protein
MKQAATQLNNYLEDIMEEKRNFFRIKNTGSIKAKYEKHDLYVIDISPSGARILANDINIKKDGVLEILINHFKIKINYKLLKKQGEKTVVAFKLEEEINSLLTALKKIRDSVDLDLTQGGDDLIPTNLIDVSTSFSVPKIENYTRLSSLYAIRLYQVVRQYMEVGSGVITLDDLRIALGVEKLKSYYKYSTLKRKILEPSKKEINDKTDLTIIYSEITEEKKVIAVKFTIMSILP